MRATHANANSVLAAKAAQTLLPAAPEASDPPAPPDKRSIIDAALAKARQRKR
jgi:hypothetical protein